MTEGGARGRVSFLEDNRSHLADIRFCFHERWTKHLLWGKLKCHDWVRPLWNIVIEKKHCYHRKALVRWLWGKHSPYNIPYFLLDYSWFCLKDGVSCITIGKSICLFVCFTNRVPALISFSSLPWKEECHTANSWGRHINYCLSWVVSLNIKIMRTSQPRIELKFLKFQPTSFLGTHNEGKGPGNEVAYIPR